MFIIKNNKNEITISPLVIVYKGKVVVDVVETTSDWKELVTHSEFKKFQGKVLSAGTLPSARTGSR